MKLRRPLILLLLAAMLLACNSCIYSKMTHLSDEDLSWVDCYNEDTKYLFQSNKGRWASMYYTDLSIYNKTSPFGNPFRIINISDTYTAGADYYFKIDNNGVLIEGVFGVYRPVDFDTLCVDGYIGRLFVDDNISARTVKFTLDGKDFNNCMVMDSTNCRLFVYSDDPPESIIEEYVISKRYGLLYFKYPDGEEFYRKFRDKG